MEGQLLRRLLTCRRHDEKEFPAVLLAGADVSGYNTRRDAE
jgi:hypothetical protein